MAQILVQGALVAGANGGYEIDVTAPQTFPTNGTTVTLRSEYTMVIQGFTTTPLHLTAFATHPGGGGIAGSFDNAQGGGQIIKFDHTSVGATRWLANVVIHTPVAGTVFYCHMRNAQGDVAAGAALSYQVLEKPSGSG